MRLTPGTRLGPYEVVALLGAGGMAEVYRAKDTRLGREVAIKVVSEALGADGAFLERFEREAKLAGSVNHPNVVALHDVGLHDGKPYFVTELLQGETLRERLAKGPIPLGKALEWASQMAEGLAAAHEGAIAHRDLKPENVFITRDGHVKLLDFGIAKLVEAALEATPHGLMDETVSPSGSSTGTGMVLGTPGYMSPEQVRGDAVDARTDFFSLGCVLYEMLCGRRAFPSGSVVESGYAILHNEPEPLPSTVPPQVTQVVHRCLEKDPARRFQSARDLAFNLELVRTPTGSVPATTAPQPRAKSFLSKRWLWPIVGIAAALGIGVATYFIGRGARLPTPSVEQITFRRGTVWAARFTPEGRIVYSAAWGEDPEEIFTRAPGSSSAQSFGPRGAHLLSVSAQGELAVSLRPVWFGIVGAGGTLALVPSGGGAPRPVAENVVYADWSRTGELAVVRFVDTRRELEYPLGKQLFVSASPLAFPRVSPNGDAVAFFHSFPPELLLVDHKGVVRHVAAGEISGLAWAPSGAEVWFTEGAALWAVSLAGVRQLIYQGVVPMRLEDISRDGKVLVVIEEERNEMVFVPPGAQRERELPWPDDISIAGLSDDGGHVLFSTFPESDGAAIYVRPTDGSPPVKLGPGDALSFCADQKWVLARPEGDLKTLSLLPIGVGVPKSVSVERLNSFVNTAQCLRDGKRIVVTAKTSDDKGWRMYVVPLDGGVVTPVSDEPLVPAPVTVSQDEHFVAAMTSDGDVKLIPLDRSPVIPIPELGKYALPVGWTSNGQLWVSDVVTASGEGSGRHLRRYDVQTRRVVEERTLSPTDPTGLAGIRNVRITPDSRYVAYQSVHILGRLYQLDVLAPSRP